jgi:hypothetical protein
MANVGFVHKAMKAALRFKQPDAVCSLLNNPLLFYWFSKIWNNRITYQWEVGNFFVLPWNYKKANYLLLLCAAGLHEQAHPCVCLVLSCLSLGRFNLRYWLLCESPGSDVMTGNAEVTLSGPPIHSFRQMNRYYKYINKNTKSFVL